MKFYSDIDLGNAVGIINVPAPVNAGDAVNKAYADAIAAGYVFKEEVEAATTAALPANTYAAGGGGTLTANANGALVVDAYNPSVGDRLLVKNEATAANDGLYEVTQVGGVGAPYILTRTADALDGSTEDIKGGTTVFVKNGTVNGSTVWTETTDPIDIGTDAQVWVQTFASGGVAYPISVANGGTGNTTAAGARGTGGLGAQTAPTGGTGVSAVVADGIPTKVEAQIVNPTAAGSPYLITHNLGTRAVVVSVIDLTTFQAIDVTWSADTVNSINLHFDATDANTVLVTIIG